MLAIARSRPAPLPVRRPPSLVGVSEEQGYDDELLPEQTTDDTDRGWGEPPDDAEDDDERLIREKPPHW
jgi:hypothetical protein